MEVEQAAAHAMLSGEEEGEVHSDGESRPEAGRQELFSFNAPVESGAGRNEQAHVGAVAPVHAVPLSGGVGGDRQAAIDPTRAGTSRGPSQGVVQSQANKLVLDNYLNVDGVGRVLLDESVELRGVDFPQSREDSAQSHRNLVKAYATCGFKCPARGCSHQVAPRAGMKLASLERDEGYHLLSLSVEPQLREGAIFSHWESEHCPAGTTARVKAACPYFDNEGRACPQTLTPLVYDLKRHLKNVHGVADKDIASYNLRERCAKVSKSASSRPVFAPFREEELTDAYTRGFMVRSGLVKNKLLRDQRPVSPSRPQGQRRRRNSVEQPELVPILIENAGQRPPAPKKVKPNVTSGAQRNQSLAAPTADSRAQGEGEFKPASTGKSRRRHRERKHKSGVSSPGDLNPRQYGVTPVSLNTLPSKTTRSRVKTASAPAARGKGRASVTNVPAVSVDKQTFRTRRGDLMGPVRAFGDRIGYLPSLPVTANLPTRTLGYNVALVEMVLQGRTFITQFAGEYTRLVQQVRSLGMAHELGSHVVDTMLAGVAGGEIASIPGVVPPTVRRVAAAAGAPGDQAVDAASPPRRLPLKVDLPTVEPCAVVAVNCVLEAVEPTAKVPESTLSVSVEDARVLYATALVRDAATSSVQPRASCSGMVTLQPRPMTRVVTPAVSVPVLTGPPSQEEEVMDAEEANPPGGEPTLYSEAPTPGDPDPTHPEELTAMARGLMSNLNQMVDMMLRGPLASLCQEEGLALQQRFTSPSSPRQ